MHKILLLFFGVSLLWSCGDEKPEPENSRLTARDTFYVEKYRPQFHFSPERNWMNDPNGLVYHNGTYHLFYQFYPDSTVWGPMDWGHATSADLIRWKHQPIALYPDSLGYIFSGSAVVDEKNSSGFGREGKSPMVAIFTHHNDEISKEGREDFQYQSIAYSLDNGNSWQSYEDNPVIPNPGIKDFRDPKVFWHQETNQWILVLVAGDHAQFYASSDLKSWRKTGEFGKQFGAHGGVWECPDLFKLKVEDSEEEKWVLLISINPGAPNGGSGTQYFVGNFDGKKFTPDHLDTRWLDYGTDNYAGVTYNQTPEDARVFIGWMSNWEYAQVTPTKNWRSAMTLPRKLSLYKEGEEIKLKNYPVEQLTKLFDGNPLDAPENYDAPILLKTSKRKGADVKFQADLSKPLQIRLSNNAGNSLVFTANPAQQTLSVDRSKSGVIDFNDAFAAKKQVQSYLPSEELVEVRMIIDASSVEIFVDKGKYVFTTQVFPSSVYSNLNINTIGMEAVKNVEIHRINSIWVDEE